MGLNGTVPQNTCKL